MNKSWIVLAAFAAACFFFAMAVFTIDINGVLLVPAGLLSAAAGFLIERLP